MKYCIFLEKKVSWFNTILPSGINKFEEINYDQVRTVLYLKIQEHLLRKKKKRIKNRIGCCSIVDT